MKKHIAYTVVATFLFASCSQSATTSSTEGDGHNHEEITETSEVEVTKRQVETVGIKVGKLEERALGASVKVTGTLSVDPQGIADVVPMMSGVVRKITVVEGQNVAAGQVVAMIENMEVAEMQRRYFEVKENCNLAETELKRQQTLADAGAGVRRNLESAQTQYTIAKETVASLAGQLRSLGIDPKKISANGVSLTIPVKTPISGVVSVIQSRTGAYADVASPMMTITNNSMVYANLNIYEKDLSVVKPGELVEGVLTNLPSVKIEGSLVGINPTIDPQTRTFSARVRLKPIDNSVVLSPGMSLSATITGAEQVMSALPSDAIVTNGGRKYVFMLEEEHENEVHFKKVEVVIGPSAMGYTAVSFPTPVNEQARFAVAGTFYLVSMSSEHAQHSH